MMQNKLLGYRRLEWYVDHFKNYASQLQKYTSVENNMFLGRFGVIEEAEKFDCDSQEKYTSKGKHLYECYLNKSKAFKLTVS